MKALVIDCHKNGLGIIRALGRAGIEVIAADYKHKWYHPGLYSKYVTERHLIESSLEGRLFQIGWNKKEKIVLFPVSDRTVERCCQFWPILKPYYIPAFETRLDVLDQCLNKRRFSKLALSLGISVPTWDYDSWPVVIKPELRSSGASRFRLVHTHDEFITAHYDMGAVPYVAQRYIPGGDDQLYGVVFAAYKGRILGLMCGRKLHQFPAGAGEASYAKSVVVPLLEDYARRVVSAVNYTGLGHLEFKYHNGIYYILEMNPRSWSWNALTNQAGMNAAVLMYEAVTGGPQEEMVRGVRPALWHYFLGDWLAHGFKSAVDGFRRADVHGIYDPKDLKPWLVQLATMLPFWIRKRMKDV